jgi:small conductance mechanosensitive channel
VNFDLVEDVKKAFDENGIDIPYPQMDIHIDNK